MRSPTRPAADEIGMRCKPLFYFSRWPLVFGRWLLVVGNTILCHPERRIIVRLRTMIRSRGTLRFRSATGKHLILGNDQRPTANDRPYPGLSRCTTFTRYPAFRKRFETSSAIMTDRCCPPVQPKEIVR